MSGYDNDFFDYVNSGATRSAQRVLPLLLQELQINSVLDVGCGQGAWLAEWQRQGVKKTQGIDGSYVDRNHLLIDPENFTPGDLSEDFNIGARFDLVQSLEVAEHLPESRAAGFVANLVAHGDLVFFSAAPKGQGGDHHVNEQSYDYWRKLFAQHDYIAIDYIRPQVRDDAIIEPWYRYNTFLYASAQKFQELPEKVSRSRIPDDETLADISPALYKVRKSVVRILPVKLMTLIAKIKERNVVKSRNSQVSERETK